MEIINDAVTRMNGIEPGSTKWFKSEDGLIVIETTLDQDDAQKLFENVRSSDHEWNDSVVFTPTSNGGSEWVAHEIEIDIRSRTMNKVRKAVESTWGNVGNLVREIQECRALGQGDVTGILAQAMGLYHDDLRDFIKSTWGKIDMKSFSF